MNNKHIFEGVIEDVNDPEEMGRARVRCFGYHTDNRDALKTEQLPWAHVMTPINSASTSGIGLSATGLVKGSWVVGFFRDGANAQDPIIIGSIPSRSDKLPNFSFGFSDPEGKYPTQESLKKPDTPLASTKNFRDSDAFKSKKSTKNGVGNVTSAGGCSWEIKAPENYIAPKYPKNHTYRTESGHTMEFDDTSGKERISLFHSKGSFIEMDGAGDGTIVIKGSHYELIVSDKNVYIKGNMCVTIDGDMNTKVGGNYNLEVGGDMITEIVGKQELKVGEDQLIEVGGKQEITATGDTYIYNNVIVEMDVVAGTNKVSLIDHRHRDSAGLKPGITTKPL